MGFEFKNFDKPALRQYRPATRSETDWSHQGIIWESVKIQTEAAVEEPRQPTAAPVELFRDELYDCAFCKGTGEKPRGAVCSACKGKKQIRLTPPVVKCAACKGRGEERPRTNITCTPCRGTGWIAVREPIEKCQACRGRGRTSGSNLPCVRCKGAGVVTIKIGGY
ncbi:hypothetical protein MYX75_01470 [Acidobacteria bacterium AH-259-A15]|nr:hypothetical protein [Acidobacteria bacterium AH-259-A15]MDA2936918.1 hypothetical protein [Acidobacteria bacterium AH-259-A15]